VIYEFKIRRVRRSKASDNVIRIATPEHVAETIRPLILGEVREHFFTLCIGPRHELLGYEKTAIGGMTSVEICPRDVFRTAIVSAATGIILCHNHPSGDPTPSREDAALTERFMRCGEMLGIPVYDHVIVTESDDYSFARDSRMIEVILG
jgi:DNA repair protein RadC